MKRLAQVWLVITSAKVTVTWPPQLSLVVTAVLLPAGIWPAHCTVAPAGHAMVGGVLSNTVIVRVQVAILLQASVTR